MLSHDYHDEALRYIYNVSFFIIFIIYTVILLIASTAKSPVPAWVGVLDVGIVVLIAFTAFVIHGRIKDAPRYDISYQIEVYLFPLIIVSIWVFRGSIDFNILLPGIAWRTYFFSILPHPLRLWNKVNE